MIKGAFNSLLSPQFTLWTDDQCHKMHMAALEILGRTGVLVYHQEALGLLKEAGCLVSGNLVKYPPALADWALKSAPQRIVLCTTEGQRTVFLEGNTANFGIGNDLPWFYDSRSKEIRKARLSDVEEVAKVADALEHLDFVGSLALPSDVTTELTDIYNFRALRSYTQKPILSSASDRHAMMAMIEMGIVSAGSEEVFRHNPNFAIYCETTSPLINSEEALDKLLLCAEYGVPVTYVAAPLSGSTGPVSMAGTIALSLAESLSGLVIHQLRHPGAPFILGSVPGPQDMLTRDAVHGDPMVAQWNSAMGAMGRFYNLPTYGTSGAVDACVLDLQAAMEATYTITAAMLSGANLIHNNGSMGSGSIGNLEQLMMTNEIIAMLKHFNRGIEINDETVPLDLIDEIGPGGHYLAAEHTMKHFRQETWYPRFMNRKKFSEWVGIDGKDMGQKLNQRVLELISEEKRTGVSEKQLAEMDRIIAEQEARIKAKAK